MGWCALTAVFVTAVSLPWLYQGVTSWRTWCGMIILVSLLAILVCSAEQARFVVQASLLPCGLFWFVAIGLTSFAVRCAWWRHAWIGLFLVIGWWCVASYQMASCVITQLQSPILALQPRPSQVHEQPYDIVWVLGGGVLRSPEGWPQLGQTGDRASVGARFFRSQRTSCLYTSGAFAPDTSILWQEWGIPVASIHTVREPRNTAEEIQAIASFMHAEGWKRVGVVSSAWHLPRVLRLAQKEGIVIYPLPSDWLGTTSMSDQAEWWLPRMEGLRLLELSLKEYVACWFI